MSASIKFAPLTDTESALFIRKYIKKHSYGYTILLLERADGHINICEMKFSKNEYRITEVYDARLRERMNTFVHHTGTKATLQSTFITTYGLARNEYSGNVQSQITLDDLFGIVPR